MTTKEKILNEKLLPSDILHINEKKYLMSWIYMAMEKYAKEYHSQHRAKLPVIK